MSRTLKNTIDCVLENALVHRSRLKLTKVAKIWVSWLSTLPREGEWGGRERRVRGRERMRRCGVGERFHG